MGSVVHVNDESFQTEVLDNDLPVLVDFWAEWCGPCKAIGPIIEELAGEYNGKVKVVKVNTEEATQTPSKYGIRGIPTLILFKNGEVVDQLVGAAPKASIVDFISKAE